MYIHRSHSSPAITVASGSQLSTSLNSPLLPLLYTPLSQQPGDHSGIRQPVVHLSELALIASPIHRSHSSPAITVASGSQLSTSLNSPLLPLLYTSLSQQPCDHSGIRQPVVHLSELALIASPTHIFTLPYPQRIGTCCEQTCSTPTTTNTTTTATSTLTSSGSMSSSDSRLRVHKRKALW